MSVPRAYLSKEATDFLVAEGKRRREQRARLRQIAEQLERRRGDRRVQPDRRTGPPPVLRDEVAP